MTKHSATRSRECVHHGFSYSARAYVELARAESQPRQIRPTYHPHQVVSISPFLLARRINLLRRDFLGILSSGTSLSASLLINGSVNDIMKSSCLWWIHGDVASAGLPHRSAGWQAPPLPRLSLRPLRLAI